MELKNNLCLNSPTGVVVGVVALPIGISNVLSLPEFWIIQYPTPWLSGSVSSCCTYLVPL